MFCLWNHRWLFWDIGLLMHLLQLAIDTDRKTPKGLSKIRWQCQGHACCMLHNRFEMFNWQEATTPRQPNYTNLTHCMRCESSIIAASSACMSSNFRHTFHFSTCEIVTVETVETVKGSLPRTGRSVTVSLDLKYDAKSGPWAKKSE